MTEVFINGYERCSGAYTVNLAIGTNNDNIVSTTYGKAFGRTVQGVYNWVATNNKAHVVVWGADDIEAWNGTTTYTHQANWYAGFSTTSNELYVDTGGATGCPTTHYTGRSPTCNYGWTQGAFYNVAWGFAKAVVAPETYFTNTPVKWYNISEYAYLSGHSKILPRGPLSTDTASTLSTTTAWNKLSYYFPTMQYSLYIYYLSVLA